MFFHICSVFIQLILTEEGHHLVPMGATEKIAVLMDVCVCMYVRVLCVHVWFSPQNHDRAQARARRH